MDDNKFNSNTPKDNNNTNKKKTKVKENEEGKTLIISEIVHNRCFIYFCFFWARKKKNMQNTLINEGINIFKKKMDLIRFFKKLYRSDDKDEEMPTINMSEPCTKTVLELLKKSNNKNIVE